MKTILKYILIAILGTFTLLTLFMSSSVLFDWFGIRAREGNYVTFVVISNFIASWLYIWAIVRFFQKDKNAVSPMLYATVLLIIAFIALKIHIHQGGIYELKTVGAMQFRIGITALFTLLIRYIQKNKK